MQTHKQRLCCKTLQNIGINYVDQRLWREDLNVRDMESTEQLEAAAMGAVTRLEEWLREAR